MFRLLEISMKSIKPSDIEDKQGKEVFLSYLNDDNQTTSGYVLLLECGDFVVFQTSQNIVKIPLHRILKIKEKIK